LAAVLAATLIVGWAAVAAPFATPTRAADPISDARARQAALQRTIAAQQAELSALRTQSAQLDDQLAVASAALSQVAAEYDRVAGLLVQVGQQVDAITARLETLNAQIAELDRQLGQLAADIATQTAELKARERLLQDHLRAAYEQSQTSLLEILLSADSLDAASNQVGYLLNVSDQDTALANDIRRMRGELEAKQRSLAAGRADLATARAAARSQADALSRRQAELAGLQARLGELRASAEQKKVAQADALNRALVAQGNVQEQLRRSRVAAEAANALVNRLLAQEAARQKAIAEAKARAEQQAQQQAQQNRVSARGFRWPEASFSVNQEWGPTTFALEPPYTYNGTYYPHFHAGIDLGNGCGTPILAAGAGVVAASGQPLMPFDSGFGVVIDHGGGVVSWYWHMQPVVVVQPGQQVLPGQLIGYEGMTGLSTGCHVHFAINDNGVWTNPRWYLP
jgi:murein DD-endopeptidase MepM/ murein hydrolase activator NlpD